MKHSFFAVLLSLFVMCSAGAQAQSTMQLFPPLVPNTNSECEGTGILAWAKGGASTYCFTGQQVFTMALGEECKEGDVISVNDKKEFVCQSLNSVSAPSATDPQSSNDQSNTASQNVSRHYTHNSSNNSYCAPEILPGTNAGHCSQSWGGHRAWAIAPAYVDTTRQVPAKSLRGFRAIKGCSCPDGWTLVKTGACEDPHCGSNNLGEFVYKYTCVKN